MIPNLKLVAKVSGLCKMYLVSIFLLLLFEKTAFGQILCSSTQSYKTCICKRRVTQTFIATVADCSNLGYVRAPNITDLPKDLSFLDLSHNYITSLDDVRYSSLVLTELILSFNTMASIPEDFFTELPNLAALDLSHNNFSNFNFTLNNPKLTKLDLSFNNIQALNPGFFANLINLKVLNLGYNTIELGRDLSASPDYLVNVLGLTQTLEQLEMDKLGLRELHISYFNNFTNLSSISLADNHLISIPVVPYTVQVLDLSGSDFEVLQAKNLSYHSLKVLKLERLKLLQSIHHYAFYNLQSLEELYITDCPKLQEFNELVFGAISKNTIMPLRKLSLARNGLAQLNNTYKFLFNRLEAVDLRDNPWSCNCEILWFQEITTLFKSDSVRCWSYGVPKWKKILDITTEDLPDCHPEKYGTRAHRILVPVLIILVIMLSSLIGYLIYYAPSFSNRRDVGPDSPYNLARTDGS